MPPLAVTPLTSHNIMQISVCVALLLPADQLANSRRVSTPVCNMPPSPTSGYPSQPELVSSQTSKRRRRKKRVYFFLINSSRLISIVSNWRGPKPETRQKPFVFIFYLFSSATFDPFGPSPAGTGPSAWMSAACDADTQLSVKPKHPARLIRRDLSLIPWTLWTLRWPPAHRASQNSRSWRA